jgi:hypothetical protein
MDVLLKAQVENSIQVGWKAEDMIVVTNFDYEFMGVKAYNTILNKTCLTGSKMFGLQWAFDNGLIPDVVWASDLDAWQSVSFKEPKFKDVGITTYSTTKFNGGSVFWRKSAKDIIDHVVTVIAAGENKEEPTLNKLLKSDYKDRTTVVDTSFNVGCSGFIPRLYRAVKPIRVCHLNPLNRIAWETHRLDRNGMGLVSVSSRLELLLRKYYPHLATELSEEGLVRSEQLREENTRKLLKENKK